jgi:phage terminase small subunit
VTPRQKAFVDEYLIDLNGAQAAVRAGYSAKTAEVQGSRLLGNAKVAIAITAAKAARSERTKVDADWVLSRLHEEAEADVNDLYDPVTGQVKPIKDWPLIWRKGLVAGIESYPEKIGEDEDGKPIFGTGYKLKMSDRARRVEMLGKHVYVSAFREQIDHTSSDGSMSPPSLADFYRGQSQPREDGETT